MSVLGDWGDALAGPFESYGGTFKTLFTNPGKLQASDIPTLVLPIPGAGSTISYDIKHPEAAAYQAGTLAAIAAPVNALWTSYAPDYASSLVASNSAENAAAGAYLFGNGSTIAAAAPIAPGPGDTAALVAADFGGGSSPVNAALALNAKAAAAAPASTLGTTAKVAGGASVVKSALSSFVQNVKDAGPLAATIALLKGGQPVRGAAVNGGSNPPTDARGVPVPVPVQQASAAGGSKLGTFLMLGALGGMGYWLYRHKKK